jgi:ribosomal protein S12 methylthiotransferase
VYFVSLGCAKNRVDSEVMVGVAERSGFRIAQEPDDAEVIVVNTCGFIGEAKKESLDVIFEMAELKRQGHCERLVVAGCLSQRYPTELAAQLPEVDHFLGSSDMLKLEAVLKGQAERMLVGNPADWVVRSSDPRTLTQSKAFAYVKIAEGCNRRCSFCVIPDLRGKQRSRHPDDVVREVEALVAAGVKEIDIVSQDTVAYGRDAAWGKASAADRATLATLVRRVADVPGVHWVRVFYLYPENLSEELLDLYAHHPKVVPYVDMPLQHAADSMLARMRRGHGQDRQRRVVERLREKVPHLTFRTAFIVGHPGETDEEFEDLVRFVEWAKFDHVAIFRYSDEESCASHSLGGKVPTRIASARQRRLNAIQRKIARAKNKARIGQELEVLVDGLSEEHEFVMKGRHAGQAPEIDGEVFLSEGEAAAGEIRRVRIVQASDFDLVGELIDEPAPRPKRQRVSLKVVGAQR